MSERSRFPLIPANKVKGRSVLALPEDAGENVLLAVGEDSREIQWLCGSCERPLAIGLAPGQVKGAVFRCACGAYNDADI